MGYPDVVPRISVLLPVRDAGDHLDRALGSLWRQTFRDFEVVAVDDGSTDGSGERLERAAAREPRLVVLRTPARGLPAALNLGLTAARSSLIARHDADDLSHRRRFEIQTAWLEQRPELAVTGCRLRLFPAAATGAGMRRWERWHNSLLDHEAMARELLIDSPLAHGTALFRRSWLEQVGGWQERGWPEDLDLWIRLVEAGAQLGKCSEVLYGWRQHSGNATRRDPRYRRAVLDALKRAALERGALAGRGQVTLVGVGESLARWGRMIRTTGRRVSMVEAGRPGGTPA